VPPSSERIGVSFARMIVAFGFLYTAKHQTEFKRKKQKKKVKQPRYRPGVAQRVPGS
jgi:hypothetical protein